MKHSQNKPRRREPYHYDASGAQYIACIETALQHGQSIPVHVLQLVYHMLLPYIPNPLTVQPPPGAALQLHDSVDLNKIAA